MSEVIEIAGETDVVVVEVGYSQPGGSGGGGGGAVDTVFGRTGNVTAHTGDYTAVQVGADPAGTAASAAAAAAATAQANAEAYADTFKLAKVNNLSDVGNSASARANLGLGSAATQPVSAFDTVGAAATAQVNSEAYADSSKLAKASNLLDLADAATSRMNLGLGSAATHPGTDFDSAGAAATAQANAATYTDAETTRATAAEALKAPLASPALTGTPTAPTATALTSTTQLATTAYTDSAVSVEASRATTAEGTKLAKSSNLSDVTNAATSRTNLGLGSAATHAATDFDSAGAASAAQTASETYTDAETTRATAAEATKAPLASPALTGTPTAPTATALTSTTQLATTAYADSAVGVEATARSNADALKAPLASPALTGTPTAPTASALTSTTQLATTAYADSAVSVETSRATTAEGLKAPLASPALTGNPTAPTQASSDNSTKLATTAYVTAAVAAAVQGLNIKNSAVAATTGSETFTILTGNVTIIAGTTVDGQSPAVGDYVLVKDAPASTGTGSANSTQPGNGLYQVSNATVNLTIARASDMSGSNGPAGAFVFVEGGTANGSSGYTVSVPGTNAAFTYGTNNIKWTQFSGAGEITAGTALSKTGNTLNVTTVPVANGGTGQVTQGAALDAIAGAVTTGTFARGNGTHVTMQALQGADIATNASATPASPGTGIKYALVYDSVAAGVTSPATTTWTVTHNLNNSHPQVTVWDISGSNPVKVMCDTTATSANAIQLSFATAPTSGQLACSVSG